MTIRVLHMDSPDGLYGAERFFNRPYVERMLREHDARTWDWSTHLWPLLMFRMWYRRFAP